MKLRVNKKSIVFSEIFDVSTYETVLSLADKVGCEYSISDNSTKIKITSNLSNFVDAYNNELV